CRPGNQHERASRLGNGSQVIKIVLLTERPVYVSRIIARLGGIENKDALVPDLLHHRLAASRQLSKAVALPRGRRLWSNLPNGGIGGAKRCGGSNAHNQASHAGRNHSFKLLDAHYYKRSDTRALSAAGIPF